MIYHYMIKGKKFPIIEIPYRVLLNGKSGKSDDPGEQFIFQNAKSAGNSTENLSTPYFSAWDRIGKYANRMQMA